MQRTDLHATGTSSPPVPPPPKKRIKTKQSDSSGGEPSTALPPFDLTWDNMKLVMEYYKLSERDATQLLLQVVGPDPKGATFWSRYADRIKEEQNQSQKEPVETVTKKPRRVQEPPQLLPDNQLGVPELKAEFEGTDPDPTEYDPDYECEGEGEEEADLSDDEEVAPGVSRTQDDDDQNSPNSGCVATQGDVAEKVCETQPTPPAEPTIETVVVDQAAKDAKEKLANDIAISEVPTPLTRKSSGRHLSKAIRLDDPQIYDDSFVGGLLLAFLITICFFYICSTQKEYIYIYDMMLQRTFLYNFQPEPQ